MSPRAATRLLLLSGLALVAAAAPVKTARAAKTASAKTAPGEPRSLAVFFEVSNRGEIDPCG